MLFSGINYTIGKRFIGSHFHLLEQDNRKGRPDSRETQRGNGVLP